MKHLVFLTVLLGPMACRPSVDVTPVPLTSAVTGTYQTNGFLDYRFLTLSARQMPIVTLKTTGTNTVTLTLAQAFPKADVETLTDLTVTQQPDQSYEFRRAGQVIGSLQMGRVFDASGMETQAKLLRLSYPNVTFTGYKP